MISSKRHRWSLTQKRNCEAFQTKHIQYIQEAHCLCLVHREFSNTFVEWIHKWMALIQLCAAQICCPKLFLVKISYKDLTLLLLISYFFWIATSGKLTPDWLTNLCQWAEVVLPVYLDNSDVNKTHIQYTKQLRMSCLRPKQDVRI